MDLPGLQATIKSLKVGPFKDNCKSSTNRYTQMQLLPVHRIKNALLTLLLLITFLESKPLFNIDDQ
jgi:hypothetical protein